MQALGRYLLTVITGALICAILLGMVREGAYEKLLRFLVGVFLTLLLAQPLAGRDFSLQWQDFYELKEKGEALAAQGEDLAAEEKARVISGAVEAYILDKAATMDTDITVTVALDEKGLPVKATLQGSIPEQTKGALSDMLERDLGIAKENQLWTR